MVDYTMIIYIYIYIYLGTDLKHILLFQIVSYYLYLFFVNVNA